MVESVLPSGTVTFLFTDLEVSTRLWEQEPDAMRGALARHDVILRDAVAAHGGHVVKGTGDGIHAAFATADSAIAAAIAAQLALGQEQWGVSEPLRVRMGLHTGVAELRDGDYFGSSVNRAARLMAVAHGGQILVSHATEQLVAEVLPEGCELLELGEHRLRDLGRTEVLFQVVHPGLRRDFARLSTVDAFPGNLPVRASSFVGRERDLARIGKALDASPVVTLTGVGGVGKTRLALQVAADVLPRFAEGAWFCELAAVRDPDGVVDAVAGVFRVTARPGLSLQQSVVAYLRDQEALVVLDNCEHVLRPAAALVAAIGAACARVRVLATSREGLNIEGEQILVVPSLGVPDDETDVAALGECEAVRLFVDRARAVKDDFVIDTANAEGVARVCRRLDGVPLAIELAAARVTAMNPSELAGRLDRRFRLLSGGDRVAIERHQTLRATIDWSYDLLTALEQRLLDRLAVFSGGCTLEAVEAVCAGDPIESDDVFELLARLVARHLVEADDTGPETRYRLLETIRQYGEERLAEADATDVLRARHADYYARFAGHVKDHMESPQQPEWAARLAREHDNLHAAMACALETRDLDRAMALVCQMPFYAQQVDNVVVFDPEPVLALPGASDHPGSAVALFTAAWRAFIDDDADRALELCDQAAAVEARLGPVPGSLVTPLSMPLRGHIARMTGDPLSAVEHYRAAARWAQAEGLRASAAVYLSFTATALADIDPPAAREQGFEAVADARRAGQPHALALSLLTVSAVIARDDPAAARVMLDEAVALAEIAGYASPVELQNTVFAAARLGDWTMALHAASATLDHVLRSGFSVRLAPLLDGIARGLAEREPDAAAILQGAADALARRTDPPPDSLDSDTPPPGGSLATFVHAARGDATQLILAAVGEARLRELRAEGMAMDRDRACTYARAAIEAHFAAMGEST